MCQRPNNRQCLPVIKFRDFFQKPEATFKKKLGWYIADCSNECARVCCQYVQIRLTLIIHVADITELVVRK